MWREEPKELREFDRLLYSLIGVCVAIAGLRLMMSGLHADWKFPLTFLSIFASYAFHAGVFAKWRSLLTRRLALRLPLATAIGPKYLVEVGLRVTGQDIGRDTGILLLQDGCLRFQGLRTDFSIPKTLLTRLDTSFTKVGVLIGADVVWLNFRVIERYEVKGSFATLSYAFGNLWVQDSSGELQPPPTEAQPKPTRRQLQRNLAVIGFWIALAGIGIYEAQSLAERGLREAQTILALTFALTAFAAAATPAIRLVRMFRSFRDTPSMAVTPALDRAARSEAGFQEVATVPNTR